MDVNRPRAEAVAVHQNQIFAVGTNTDILNCGLSGRRIIDCQGKTLMPGFIDSHVHFQQYGLLFFAVDLVNVSDFEEVLHRIRQAVKQTPPGQWIVGEGWNKNIWNIERFPSAADLDSFSPNHPVMLNSKEGHTIWVNTRAMEIAGINQNTPDPKQEIQRDSHGKPTGILFENARYLIYNCIPDPPDQIKEKALQRAVKECHRMGIVGAHDMSTDSRYSPYTTLQDMYHREGGRGLGMRFWCSIPLNILDGVIEAGIRSGYGNEYVRLGGLKQLTDGALGSQTAYMDEPYPETNSYGIMAIPREELKENIKKAAEHGICGVIHAIGDRCNREVIDVFEEVITETNHVHNQQNRYFRNRIEHMQCVDPELLPRVKTLGLIASVQPVHLPGDITTAEKYWSKQSRKAYIFCQMKDAGIPLAMGSDVPVETCDPILGIHAAVTRQRQDGTPPDGWYPQERLTTYDTIYGYTMGAAFASGEENIKGSITPGKLADMVLLSQNIFDVSPSQILDTKIEMTIFDGEIVFTR